MMTARDEAIEAAAKAIFNEVGPESIDADGADALAQVALAAALPVLLNDLADRIEYVGKGDENVAWSKGMMSAVLLVRHAAEGWRAD